MKYNRIYIIMLFSLLSCNDDSNSYNQAMDQCMKNVEVGEYTLADGKKGYSYKNFDLDCLIGEELPEMNAISIDGIELNKQFLNGKINIINFWFRACKPCVAEIPGLNKLVEKYGKEEINYIAISMDDLTTVNEFLSKNEFEFHHITNGSDLKKKTFRLVSGFPTTIITDNKMRIIKIFSGSKSTATVENEILEKLETIIKSLILVEYDSQ